MTERGVVVSINSDSGEEMRHLNQEAAKAVKWGGMDEVAALATVTLNPAKQFRIDDRVGSIEVGKDADLERQAKIDEIKQRILGKDEDAEKEERQGEDDEGGSDPPEVRWHDETTYSCREVH